MKAKELRELLQTVDDDAEVVIPQDGDYGRWYAKVYSVVSTELASGNHDDYYEPKDLAFPPIDRVNVIIIQ